MVKFRKLTALIMSAALALGAAGCGSAGKSDDGKLKIVCTIFPEYDWVRELLGDKAEDADVTYLLDKGADLHSFQPTAEDIMKISVCDLFIYVGGESDNWTQDALKEATNKDMKTLNLLDTVGSAAKEEEVKEGMQGEEEEHGMEEEKEEGPEYDEHVWLSVKNAKTIVSAICDDICELDKDNSEEYRKNLESYTAELDALDKDFTDLAASASVKTLLFGDRFPFRYFVDDYGFDYYAAFVGCSAETEASFETIAFLAGKVDELGLDTVYTIEGSDGSIAQSIVNSSEKKSAKIVKLDSAQSVSAEKLKEGTTYKGIMRSNLEVHKRTLN